MKQRVMTGVIAGAVFLTLLYLGSYWFAALMYIAAIVGFDEYLRIIQMRNSKSAWVFGLLGVLALTSPWDIQNISNRVPVEAWIWIIMFVMLAVTVFTKNKVTIDQAALVFLGIVYLGYGFHFMIQTRDLEPYGLYYTLLVFVCIWVTDSGAYFTGYFLGRTPLWPTISPKKTVEGAIGGLVFSVVAALVFSWYDRDLLAVSDAIVLGLAIGIIGQLGDLIQSAYKRVKGVKDSGTILPGHGGVLDRVDSWLIVFPVVYLLGLIPH